MFSLVKVITLASASCVQTQFLLSTTLPGTSYFHSLLTDEETVTKD